MQVFRLSLVNILARYRCKFKAAAAQCFGVIARIIPYTLIECVLSVDTRARAEVPIVVGVIGVVADSVCLIVVVPVGLF